MPIVIRYFYKRFGLSLRSELAIQAGRDEIAVLSSSPIIMKMLWHFKFDCLRFVRNFVCTRDHVSATTFFVFDIFECRTIFRLELLLDYHISGHLLVLNLQS